MNVEREIPIALERRRPEGDFAGRVISRLPRRSPRRSRLWRFAAALVLVTLAGLSGHRTIENETARRREGEVAKQQLMTAMRITAEKTRVAREALHQGTIE